jgi:hypothetical protein
MMKRGRMAWSLRITSSECTGNPACFLTSGRQGLGPRSVHSTAAKYAS